MAKKKATPPTGSLEESKVVDEPTPMPPKSNEWIGTHGWKKVHEDLNSCYEVYQDKCKIAGAPALKFVYWYGSEQSMFNARSEPKLDDNFHTWIKSKYLPQRPTVIGADHDRHTNPPQNLVQWLPRDPVTGDERIRIAMAGGEDREYYVLDQTHLPVRVLHLQYIDRQFNMVTHSVLLNDKDIPIKCTCKDHTERKHECKHIKALRAALPSRPKLIMFG